MSSSFVESSPASTPSPSVLAVLLQIHRGKQTGLLRLMHGTAMLRVWFEAGTIRHAHGFKDLFRSVVSVDPPGGFSGDLMQDMGQVMALGTDPQVALRAAHAGIVDVLVQIGLSGDLGWGFQEGECAPEGAMQLPGVLLKEAIQSMNRRFTSVTLSARFHNQKGKRLNVVGELLPSDGFPPLTLRVFRLAAKDLSLQAVLHSLGAGDPAREHTALKCIALLLELGLVALIAAPGAAEIPNRREADLADDLPCSEEVTEEITMDFEPSDSGDRLYKGESLTERRRARASRRRSSSRSAAPAEPKPSPPPAVTEARIPDDHQWFLDKAAELGTLNPLLALGLDPEKTQTPIRLDTVRAAFRKCASAFHPDRLSAYSDASKESAESVFSAFNTLRDRLDSQAAIDFSLRQLAQERSGVKEVTDFDREKARVCGRQAEMHMRHRKWKAAQVALAQALNLDPENKLMVLRTHFCAGILQQVPFVQAATAVESTEVQGKKSQTERLYRAGWLWRLGDKEAKAMRCFQDALGMEPGHLEAKRELRILVKRQAEKDEKSDRTVPFARFFKKK